MYYSNCMDDKEYYSLMNRPSSYVLQQALKLKNDRKKQSDKIEFKSYKNLETRQGKADAEMLMEKNDEN